jgi:hypothetical protein
LLTRALASPCQKRFYRLDSMRSAWTSRLVAPSGDGHRGGNSLNEEVSDNLLIGAQRSENQ